MDSTALTDDDDGQILSPFHEICTVHCVVQGRIVKIIVSDPADCPRSVDGDTLGYRQIVTCENPVLICNAGLKYRLRIDTNLISLGRIGFRKKLLTRSF